MAVCEETASLQMNRGYFKRSLTPSGVKKKAEYFLWILNGPALAAGVIEAFNQTIRHSLFIARGKGSYQKMEVPKAS